MFLSAWDRSNLGPMVGGRSSPRTLLFGSVERVAQAAADYWQTQAPPGVERKIIVGYDRRFLSDQFARRTAEVLCGNGFKVLLT
jgi:phosphomannomutase